MACTTIVGNVGNVKDLRYSNAGKAYFRFSVAWSERQRDANGTFTDGPTEWVNCTVFGKLAESASDNLRKGVRVVVSGQLRPREWAKDTGPETVFDMAVDALGVDLTFSDVQVSRRDAQQQAPQQQQQQDPWNSAPTTGGFGQQDEEPPF